MDKHDKKLINDAKRDPQDFEALYEKYAERVFNYFWYRVGHDHDIAEDLTQEVFLRAFRNLDKFRLRSYSYFSYLLTIAHNILVNYYRKPRAIPLESVGDIPIEITHDQKTSHKLDAELLWRAVQQLSDNEKDIFLLRYRKNLSIKEIARIVDKTENAVKISLSRIRKRLAHHPYLADVMNFANTKKEETKARFSERK